MRHDVSVITLHRDRPNHLLRLLEGLSRSNFAGDLVVAEMGARTSLPALPFPATQIVVSAGTLPLAHARNAGRRAACGSRLVFLDVDCIPTTGMVATLADAVQHRDALICAQVRYLRDDVRDGWTPAGLLAGSDAHADRAFPVAGLSEAAHPGLFWSLAFAIRASTFDCLTGFDETFTGYGGEDTDLAFRARDIGVPVLLCADAMAFHQPHANFEPPLQHFADVMRNAALFRDRHGIWPMQGWLDGFVRLGLIAREGDGYRIIRMPISQDFLTAKTG